MTEIKLPTLAAEDVEAEVRRLAGTYPDTVYETPDNSCLYAEGETPSGVGCIFGQALQNLGVPYEWLKKLDDDSDGHSPSIFQLAPLLGLPVDFRWGGVQLAQDDGVPWGEAVRYLDSAVGS